MSLAKLIITLTDAGAFRGASAQDAGGLPVPLTEEDLTPIAAIVNAATLADAATKATTIITLNGQVVNLTSQLATKTTALTTAQADLETLTTDRDDKAAALETAEADLETAATNLAAANARIAELEALLPPEGSVSPRQFRLALLDAGITPEQVSAAIGAAIDEETARAKALIEWEFASYIERTNPLIAAMAAALGKTSEEVDAIFTAAASL